VRRIAVATLLIAAACTRGGAPPTGAHRPNVLLITIDTLRADRVGGQLTPAINALAARGIRFSSARTTAPLTLPSHTSILTGTLPPQNGVRLNGVALNGRPTLGRIFHDAGYRTAAFVGAYVLDRRFGLSGGFDTYDDRIPRDASGAPRLEAERRGDVVVDSALAWLGRASTQPFFAWIHLYDPHAPYEPPQDYLERAGGHAYDGEVAFADAQVGRVLDWLKTSGQTDRTVVAIAGDHGEGLGDHGELTHGMLAYDSTLRVPLVLALPSEGGSRSTQAEGSTIDRAVSLAQIAATLLQAANVAVPSSVVQPALMTGDATAARSTGPRDADLYSETTYPETAGWHALQAIVDGRWKLIASSESELYDLSEDPGELRNLAPTKALMVQGMDTRAREIASASTNAPSAVPPDAAERLRALGYVSGSSQSVTDAAPNPAKQIAAWNTFERELTRLTGGDARGALPGLSKLARADPDSPVFQATYARALKDTGRAREAVDIYHRLVARSPNDATMYHDLAVAAGAAGMPAEAARAERAALALQPANAEASNGLGLLLVESGKPADAIDAFERAVQDDPSNAVYWVNLGNARRDAGDATRAEQAYRTAMEHDARSPDAANGLGVLLVQQHRAPESIRWFEQALAASPRFVEARLNLGIAYQESGNRDKAIEQYRRVIAEAASGSREYTAATRLLAALGGE
jgi:arylsulfatase A-like enzyme/Tfp pilus assembly protein PilF